MKANSKRILAFLLVAMMMFTLCACGTAETPVEETETPAEVEVAEEVEEIVTKSVEPVLTIGTTANICAFGPGGNRTERYECKMIFESLLEYDSETGEYLPKLAESYEYIDDYTLKFVIRDDVYFSNGAHLTAEDVLYSLREIWATGTMSSYFDKNDWENSYTEDDYTVVLKYTDTYGPGLSMFGQWYIYSKEWLETVTEEDWFSAPVGTAPYVLTEIEAGSHVSFERKAAEDYWGELPACEQVTYKYYADAATMFIDFETGALDAAINLSASDAARVLDGGYENVGYSVNSINDCLNLVLPENRAIWDDIRVREAFMIAIDTNAVAQAAYGVLFKEATSTLPSTVRFYKNVGSYEHDIDRAKQLMAEAGYEGQIIDLRLVTTPGNEAVSEAIQACVAPLGFNVSIEVYDPTVAVPYMRDGEVDLMLKETPGGAYLNDPCMLYDNYSPTSFLGAARQTTDEWIQYFEQALYSMSDEERAEGYAACQDYLHDNYRIMPLCERTNMLVWNTEVIENFGLAVADEPVTYFVEFAG